MFSRFKIRQSQPHRKIEKDLLWAKHHIDKLLNLLRKSRFQSRKKKRNLRWWINLFKQMLHLYMICDSNKLNFFSCRNFLINLLNNTIIKNQAKIQRRIKIYQTILILWLFKVTLKIYCKWYNSLKMQIL
jgi:hypothetical protein